MVIERGGWRSQRNAFHLGVYAGALIERLGLTSKLIAGKDVVWVEPKRWKLAVLGNGNASKDDAIAWATAEGEVATNDEAEARAMSMYGCMKRRKP